MQLVSEPLIYTVATTGPMALFVFTSRFENVNTAPGSVVEDVVT